MTQDEVNEQVGYSRERMNHLIGVLVDLERYNRDCGYSARRRAYDRAQAALMARDSDAAAEAVLALIGFDAFLLSGAKIGEGKV